jgi:hypothetical protein
MTADEREERSTALAKQLATLIFSSVPVVATAPAGVECRYRLVPQHRRLTSWRIAIVAHALGRSTVHWTANEATNGVSRIGG